MNRRTKIKLAVIVPLLCIFAAGVWVGVNLLVARQLCLLHLVELQDYDGVAYVCKWDPKQAGESFQAHLGLASQHTYIWGWNENCQERQKKMLSSPATVPSPPTKAAELTEETPKGKEIPLVIDGKVIGTMQLDPNALVSPHVGGIQAQPEVDVVPFMYPGENHRCRHCFVFLPLGKNPLQMAVDLDDLVIAEMLLRTGVDPLKMVSVGGNNNAWIGPSEKMNKLLRQYGWPL